MEDILDMPRIIKKYHLEPNSQLVMCKVGFKGVDCWFDTNTVRQHRCVSVKDFYKLKNKSL